MICLEVDLKVKARISLMEIIDGSRINENDLIEQLENNNKSNLIELITPLIRNEELFYRQVDCELDISTEESSIRIAKDNGDVIKSNIE